VIVNFEKFLKPTVIEGLYYKKLIYFKFRLCLVIILKLFFNFQRLLLRRCRSSDRKKAKRRRKRKRKRKRKSERKRTWKTTKIWKTQC
jgi:hypothetical protein